MKQRVFTHPAQQLLCRQEGGTQVRVQVSLGRAGTLVAFRREIPLGKSQPISFSPHSHNKQ